MHNKDYTELCIIGAYPFNISLADNYSHTYVATYNSAKSNHATYTGNEFKFAAICFFSKTTLTHILPNTTLSKLHFSAGKSFFC